MIFVLSIHHPVQQRGQLLLTIVELMQNLRHKPKPFPEIIGMHPALAV